MLGTIFFQSAIKHLSYYKNLGDKTFVQLNEEQIHFSPNEESNSIAIIIQHLNGNMLSRWTGFLTTDGEKSWRIRDEEFKKKHFTKEELLTLWEKGWACCLDTLTNLKEEDALKIVTIRHEELTVIDAVNRQLSHIPYHIGQIIYIGKILKNSHWNSLSIKKHESKPFNDQMQKKQS